jgi:hypothetical protein
MKQGRRGFLNKLMASAIFSSIPPIASPSSITGLETSSRKLRSYRKIDIHTHISSDAVYLREIMDT